MAQKGLTKQTVVDAAVRLIEAQGEEAFSMRLLADTLGVKTASLYNHIKSMDALLDEVCRAALRLLSGAEFQAIEHKSRAQAVRALAETYRRFGKEHAALYWLAMNRAARGGAIQEEAAYCLTEPLVRMMEGYALPDEEKIHFRRFFRSIVHGFLSQEREGFFSHYPADPDESFRFAVERYINNLEQAEKGREH